MNTLTASFRFLALLAVFSTPLTLRSADLLWTNTSGGNWNVAANWSPNLVPGASDNALITAAGNYIVVLNASASVGSLVLGNATGMQVLTNTAAGNTLTLGGASTVSGAGILGWANGTLTGEGSLTIESVFAWSGGSLSGLGSTVIAEAGRMVVAGNAVKVLGGRTLVNGGRIDWAGLGNINFNVGLVTNATTGIIEIQNNESLTDGDGMASPALLVNEGVVRKVTATGVTTLSGLTAENRGTISVQGGTVTVTGTLNNRGLCEVQLGTLNLNGGGAHSGSFQTEAAGAITFSAGSHTIQAGAEFAGAGTFRLAGNSTGLVLEAPVQASQFEVTAGSLTGAGDFTVTNRLTWSGGTLTGVGAVDLPFGSTLEMSGTLAKTLSGRTVRLGGEGTWTGTGDFVFQSGVLEIEVGGLFDVQNNEPLTDNDGAATVASINNAGTFRKSVGTQTTTITTVVFNNAGRVEVESGTVALAGGASSGVFEVAGAGALLNFASGAHSLQTGAALTGAGLARLIGSQSSLTVGGEVGAARFEMAQGTLNATGSLAITNGFTWSGGTLGGGGSIVLLPGSTNGVTGTGSKTLNGPTLRNGGTLTWAGTGGLSFPEGRLENLAGAVMEIQSAPTWTDADGEVTPATLENEGTFRKAVSSGTLTLSRVLCNNSGLVEVEAGTLALAGGISNGRFSTTTAGTLVTFNNGTHTLGEGAALTGLGVFRVAAAGATLAVEGTVGADQFDLTAGTVNGAGTLRVTNSLDWLGGAWAGSGSTVVLTGGTMSIAGTAVHTLSGRTLVNEGAGTWSGNGNLTFNAGIFRNGAGGVFEVQNDRTISDNDGTGSAVRVVNEGTFRKSGTTGTTTFTSVPLDNSGTLDIQTGTLSLAGGVGTGTFVAAGGAVLVFGSGTNQAAGAAFQGSGVFRLSGSTTVLDVTAGTTTPQFEMTGGHLTGAGTLTVAGTFSWSGGRMSGSGVLEIPASAVLQLSATGGGLQLEGRTIRCAGRTVQSGNADLLFNSGLFEVLPGGVFDIQNERSISDLDGGQTPAVFLNSGLFTKISVGNIGGFSLVTVTNSGSMVFSNASYRMGGPFDNPGTVTVENGTVSVDAGGSTSGRFVTQTPASRVIFGGGATRWLDGAELVGLGTNELQFATVEIEGAVGVDNLWSRANSRISGPGALSITNSFLWEEGTLTGPGSVDMEPGATLTMAESSQRTLDGRTLNNRGRVLLSGTFGSTQFREGILNNLAGGILDFTGNHGLSDIDGPPVAALMNAGTIRCSSGAFASLAGLTVTNSGAIEVSGGFLQIQGPLVHSGTGSITNGTLQVLGGSATGTFALGAGGEVAFIQDLFEIQAGGAFLGQGVVRIAGGTLSVVPPVSLPHLALESGSLAGPGTVTLAGDSSWSSGAQEGTGVTLVPAGVTLAITNNSTSMAWRERTLRNSGLVYSSGGSSTFVNFESGRVENLGTFRVAPGGGWQDNAGGPLFPDFENAGVFESIDPGDELFGNVRFRNAGTATLNFGSFRTGTYIQTAGITTLTEGVIAAGTIQIDGGTVQGNGGLQAATVSNSGIIAPGASPGGIVISGAFTQGSAGRLNMEVGGNVFGTFDNLQVSETATLNGQLHITLLGGYQPGQNDSIPIVISTLGLSGQFATVTGGELGGGFALRPSYSPSAVLLSVKSVTNSTTELTFAAPVLKANGDIDLPLNGGDAASFTVQASTNLLTWEDLVTVSNPGPGYIYTVTNRTDPPVRFFRTRQ